MAAATEAADGVTKLKLRLVHGTKVHNICVKLPCSKQGGVLTVSDIVTVVEKVANVPARYQKLISKGKTLDPNSKISLKEQGFKDNSKILLLGKKPEAEAEYSQEDKEFMKKMEIVESSVEGTEKMVNDIIDGLHKGDLTKTDEIQEALSKTEKQLLGANEECARHLEALDALILGKACADVKARRKAIVVRIQAILSRSDEVKASLHEIRENLGQALVMTPSSPQGISKQNDSDDEFFELDCDAEEIYKSNSEDELQ